MWQQQIIACLLFIISCNAHEPSAALIQLKASYPDHIKDVSEDFLIWTDNTRMLLGVSDKSKSREKKLNEATLADQLEQSYILGKPEKNPVDDPGRIRYEPFFRKMYGNSPKEVEANLEKINWMPRIFGEGYFILEVTRVNKVHEKIQAISRELEQLVVAHPEYTRFLKRPGGTYCWRTIAGTSRLSNHSFGMTIDINTDHAHYWQWDLKKEGKPISEEAELTYKNEIPWKIVAIFEKYGFIWGGKWYHYDTMHFEYRPELMVAATPHLILRLSDFINKHLLKQIFSPVNPKK